MKIKHIWSILCKESLINQDDNLISLNGALEELTITLSPGKKMTTLPDKVGIPINYEIVSSWFKNTRDELAKAEIEYTLTSPEGNELFKKVQNMEMPSHIRRFRSRMKVTGMPIIKAGDYIFKISVKETGEKIFKIVSEIPLEVKIKIENPSAQKPLN